MYLGIEVIPSKHTKNHPFPHLISVHPASFLSGTGFPLTTVTRIATEANI